MVERVDIVVTETGSDKAATGIAKIGVEATKTDAAVAKTRDTLGRFTGAAAATQSPLAAMAQQVEQSRVATTGLSASMGFLQTVIAGLAVGTILNQYKELSDTFTSIVNRLKLVTGSAQELAATEQQLLDSANRTRASFEATSNLYLKLALQAGQLGIEQKSLIPTIETINQLIAISGTTAIEAQSGLMQFSQGLASNRFQGDELRSVLENIPALGQAIAKGLGTTTGGLRKMGEEGQLTAKLVLDAINKSAPEIAKQFAGITPTISGAIQVVKNNLLQLVGTFDQVNGVGSRIASVILVVGNNLGFLANALATAAAAALAFYAGLAVQAGWNALVAGAGVARLALMEYVIAVNLAGGTTTAWGRALFLLQAPIAAVTAGVRALWIVIAANPFTAIITIIGAAAAALYFFGQSVKLNSDGSITALGAVVGIVNVLWNGLKTLGGYVATVLGPIFSFFGNLITQVFQGALTLIQNVLNFLAQFIPSLQGAASGLAGLAATFTTAMKDATASLNGGTLATKDFGDTFAKTSSDVVGGSAAMAGSINKVSDSLVQMGRVNAAAIPPFENLRNAAERADQMIERAKQNMIEYSAKVDANSKAVQALALTTRNAMGDMVASTDEWARRSGANYNRVSEAAQSAAASIQEAASASQSSYSGGGGGGGGGGSSTRSFQYFDNDITGGQAANPLSPFEIASGNTRYGGNATVGTLAPGPNIDWQGQSYKTRWGNGELQFLMNGAWKPDPRPWTNNITGFANGGDFMVGGSGGTDSQLVQFLASPDEEVIVRTPAQRKEGSGGSGKTINLTMIVQTPDGNSFRRSENQMLLSLRSKLNGI